MKAAIANEAKVLRCWAEWFVGYGDAIRAAEFGRSMWSMKRMLD